MKAFSKILKSHPSVGPKTFLGVIFYLGGTFLMVVLFGGSLVLVLLSLRVVILMGFVARWVFSLVPLWGHLILSYSWALWCQRIGIGVF